MAKGSAQTQQSSSIVREAPEGFRSLGSVSNAPWMVMEVDNVAYGTLEGMYQRKDDRVPAGVSKFFQVKLFQDCKCSSGKGEDRKLVTAKAGDVISVNYGPKTRELETLCPQLLQGAAYQVWIKVTGEKIKIGAGKTMWPLDVKINQTAAANAGDEEPDFGGDSADEASA